MFGRLRDEVLKCLFKPKKRRIPRYVGVFTALKTLYPDVVSKIEKLECPFCGRKFRISSSIIVHLTHNRHNSNYCSFKLLNIVDHVIEVYLEVKAKFTSTGDMKKYVIEDRNGVKHGFTSITEAITFYINECLPRKNKPSARLREFNGDSQKLHGHVAK